jgi:hypothetical protein
MHPSLARFAGLVRGVLSGFDREVPKTHRYLVSAAGRQAITALPAARNARVEEWTRCAG